MPTETSGPVDPHSRPTRSTLARLANRYARLWTLPTTLDGLHLLGCVAVGGARLIGVIQLMAALPSSMAVATRPIVDAALALVFVVESAWLLRHLIRSQSPSLGRVAVIDVALVCGLLLGQLLYVSPGGFVATWQAWGFGISMSTVLLVSLAAPNFRTAIAGAVALAASYVASVIGDAEDPSELMTVATNAFGFLANVLVARFVWVYLVRLARDADGGREVIARRRHEDRMRMRDLLHEQTNLLAIIAEWDALARDGRLQESTRRRARMAANTFRAILNDHRDDAGGRTLGAALAQSCANFPHLNITVMTDLVDDLALPPEVLDEIESVIATLLTNVHKHAGSDAVTVHGDVLATDRRYEVSVHDDGVGFDPHLETTGYGWRAHVPGATERIGAVVAVRSSPGTGTTVTIRGPIDWPAGHRTSPRTRRYGR